jgi:gliding motility-associated-like protein
MFTNTSVAPPGKPFRPGTFTWNFGDGGTDAGNSPVVHGYANSGTYNVQLILTDTNYCNYPDTTIKTVRVSPLVKAQFEIADGCAPYNAVFNNTSLAGQNFFWDFGDGSPESTEINPSHLYADTGTYTISLLALDSNTCNKRDSIRQTIRISPKPQAAFTHQPAVPVSNTPTVFYNSSTGASNFTWLFGDGDSTVKTSLDTVIHQYQQTFTYNACLIAFNQYGCSDTVCQPVENLINSLLDVPNAFTPGRFGVNGTIMVKGFGIMVMNWKIYNRWGQVVFETNNPFGSWDGTFNGTPQPMDVYAYTLDVTFYDGSKMRKTGDITLIR